MRIKYICPKKVLLNLFFRYEDIEPLANNCTEVLVWHTMTAAPEPVTMKEKASYKFSNLQKLISNLNSSGMVKLSPEGQVLQYCLKHQC